MKLFNLYFLIFTDIYRKIKSIPKNKDKWKFGVVFLMSLLMSINFFVLIHFLQEFIMFKKFYYLKIDIFKGYRLDYIISYFTLFYLPSILLNILTLNYFVKNEFKLSEFKYYNGKLFLKYSVISYLLFVFYLIILANK